ncbi:MULTISPECIES: hypothetical protein [Enterobacterales]
MQQSQSVELHDKVIGHYLNIKPRFRSQFRNKLLHTEHQEA